MTKNGFEIKLAMAFSEEKLNPQLLFIVRLRK